MSPELPAAPDAAPHTLTNGSVFPTNLPETDGEPLDSDWRRAAIDLLLEVVWFFYRLRHDFFAGGNMFLYYSTDQVRNKDYRGPDFFFVWGVNRDKDRRYWATWEEGGKYPDVIVELLSPTTAEVDRTTKKALYEQVFHTHEYFLYDPDTRQLEGYRLYPRNGHFCYEPIEREGSGRLWSKRLELYLGTWEGEFQGRRRTWLRAYDVYGNLIPTWGESGEQQAQVAKQCADEARLRAEQALRQAEEAARQASEAMRKADEALRQAEDEKRLANHAQRQAEDEKHRADEALRQAERLAEKLRSLGIDPKA